MGFQTTEEVKAGFVSAFPLGTGDLAHEIGQSLTRLHLKWKNYRCLYGTSRERIDLLNSAAPGFFRLLHGALWNDVLLAVTRLIDPPRSASRDNASLGRLIESLESSTEQECLSTWKQKLTALQEYCAPIRKRRNRSLAHEDLETALEYHADPPAITRVHLEEVLRQLRDLFGSIETRFRGSAAHYDRVIPARGDGEALVAALERAKAHRECVRQARRRRAGLLSEDE